MDEEGYVLPDVYVEAKKNLYTEDSLKALVEKVATDCITEVNALTKGRYKAKQI